MLNAEFRHFILQDLDSEQIQDFIYRWHELTFTDAVDKVRKRERLQRGIEASKAIAELAGNPLLLTMMAILNRNQELPRKRAELYEEASRVLLHRWDVERVLIEDKRLDPKTIDYKDKQAMLRQVAYLMQTGEKGLAGNLINENDLVKVLTDYLRTIEFDKPREAARVMINQLRTRNFMLCFRGADYYAFVHRTFLEYFCAWEFVWQFKETQTLTIEELKNEVFGKHWQDESWHEVLLLIAGMIEPIFVGEILEYLMAQDGEEEKFVNLFLAAKCLVEVRNRHAIELVDNKLREKIKGLTKYGNVINISQPITEIEDFEKDIEHNNSVQEIRTKAITALVSTWQDYPDILPWLKKCATSHEDRDVRYVAVQELALKWRDDPDIKALLKKLATSDKDDYVRYAAVQELALGWKYDLDIKALLQESTTDSCEEVREFTLLALVRSWKDDPDTVAILKHHAVSDFIPVQQTVIYELAKGWKHDPTILPFLKEIARNDKEGHLRQVIVEQIAKGWKDNPEVLRWLAEYTRFDHIFNHNSNVAREALRELARSFKDDTNTKAFLEKHATSNEDDSDLPAEAVRELARGWKDNPDTLTFLKELATRDGNSCVQSVAMRELTYGWKENPDTLSFLKQLATSDKYSIHVQRSAVQELARAFNNEPGMFEFLHVIAITQASKSENLFDNLSRTLVLGVIIKQFPQHPQTLPLLRDRAQNDPDEQVREFAQKKLAQLEK
ncbi:HEAT repeat domain-containing protein [Nostoc sp. UHCC 0252]|nr:HEAT repeat domain-containing protein [Nostoc sp. UHCC 0252]MEA5600108.1 HEAT repeat domain-containing protein [Nostoc sp. UHCC 0252]